MSPKHYQPLTLSLARGMLAGELEERPIASQILFSIAVIDKQEGEEDHIHASYPLFGGCCQLLYKNVPRQQAPIPTLSSGTSHLPK